MEVGRKDRKRLGLESYSLYMEWRGHHTSECRRLPIVWHSKELVGMGGNVPDFPYTLQGGNWIPALAFQNCLECIFSVSVAASLVAYYQLIKGRQEPKAMVWHSV